MTQGLLVAGTTSDAGKSLVTAGICRWLARQGVRVAPFKAQNMSNNSMVCPDGAEIGRAQWVQALACGVTPEAAMNPVLLKPGSDRRSHVVLMGQPWGELQAGEWATGRRALAQAAFEAFRDLRARHDVVIAEGAGSPAEINLRPGDYVNLGLARAVDLPVVVVGDIDRGGVLAAFYGTLGILDPEDQDCIKAWIVNKFRGDLGLLEPGLRMLEERTGGRPVLGVLPYLQDVWLDSEDALAISGWSARGARGVRSTRDPLRVAVVRFPRVSNATDVDALALEPGVHVEITTDPVAVETADLAVLPGSRATRSDLAWLRERGLADAVVRRAGAGRPVLGICGGYQMLAEEILDPEGVEGLGDGGGLVAGLGLLPTRVTFERDKHLGTPTGEWHGHPVTAYLIHHGVSERVDDPTSHRYAETAPFLDGWHRGAVWGTTWHGAFESDDFRRAFLQVVAERTRPGWASDGQAVSFAEQRAIMLDRLADAVEQHLDTRALRELIGL
ncbi:cobyric acid synthase [Arsenicicoccus dermatophilus]|uniref:cobyric acid synthase n=1 Tax=Arsenicicoccus dermatophilus TaxID=1076331 RepID=UPI001F4D2BF0|nr:cobyric acid synthase [Arsenicicoccus dermatophilus]MCH8612711.1 cobyric acid synthase [Arsenicicoccus dermatophilus]